MSKLAQTEGWPMDEWPLAVVSAAGSLARCVHEGSFPESSKAGGTTIGTNDPAVWQHLLWFDGEFWAATLLSDVMGHVSSFEELKGHFDHWRDSGRSPWRRVAPPARGKLDKRRQELP